MSSDPSNRLLDLGKDLPTTAADVEALRRAACIRVKLDMDGYLEFLAQFSEMPVPESRLRRVQRGWEPFTLPSD